MSLSIESRMAFATGTIAPRIDARMDSLLGRMALRRGLLASKNIVTAERDHLLEELNYYKIENELL